MALIKKVSAATLTNKPNLTSSSLVYHKINWYSIAIIVIAVTPVLIAIASVKRGYFSIGGESFLWIIPLVLGLENDPNWRA